MDYKKHIERMEKEVSLLKIQLTMMVNKPFASSLEEQQRLTDTIEKLEEHIKTKKQEYSKLGEK